MDVSYSQIFTQIVESSKESGTIIVKGLTTDAQHLYDWAMAQLRKFTPEAYISGAALFIVAVLVYSKKQKLKKSEKNQPLNLSTQLLEKAAKTISEELKLEHGKKLEFHESKIDELTQIEKEIAKLMAEMPALTEEINDLKTAQELSRCGTDAQKKMQEHLHSKIEDLAANALKISKSQDGLSFRQNQQADRMDDLERTLDDLMNQSVNSRLGDDLHLPRVSNILSDFKATMKNELEEYLDDQLRTSNENQSRKFRDELEAIKGETFDLTESALKHDNFVAQEMRDLQNLLQDSEKRIKSQMCEMENRLKLHKTLSRENSPRESSIKPLYHRFPASSNTSGVSSEGTVPGTPVTASTPLNNDAVVKEARRSFPSKIRPPNNETPKGVMTHMAKALKESCKKDSGDACETEEVKNCTIQGIEEAKVPKIPLSPTKILNE